MDSTRFARRATRMVTGKTTCIYPACEAKRPGHNGIKAVERNSEAITRDPNFADCQPVQVRLKTVSSTMTIQEYIYDPDT